MDPRISGPHSPIVSQNFAMVCSPYRSDKHRGARYRSSVSSFHQAEGYIFPIQSGPVRTPPDSEWASHLITADRIDALYAQEPWNDFQTRVAPVSFKPVGWFRKLFDLYHEFEDRDRQVLWEATHVLPLIRAQRERDPDLETFAQERKQRRSRSGFRWKAILKFLLQGMIEGHCDLNIFLDSFFKHFPRSNERRMWYPGLGTKHFNPPNLATALYQSDAVAPWRNQYRAAIAHHPGSSLPRLVGKFITT